MRNRDITARLFVLLLLALVTTPIVADDEVALDIPVRKNGTSVEQVVPGTPPAVPSELHRAKAGEKAIRLPDNVTRIDDRRHRRGRSGRDDEIRRGDDSPRHGFGAIARRGARAGDRLATTWVDLHGRAAYFEVGFYRGLHGAFDDPRLGRRDYRAGMRDGRENPRAWRRGERLGDRAAERTAPEDAVRRVRDQFHDLRREPRFDPRPEGRVWDGRLPAVAAPRLEDAFGLVHRDRYVRNGYRNLRHDGWWLYARKSHRALYDRDWSDPRAAFGTWRSNHRDLWRSWDDATRRVFREAFFDGFARGIDRAYDTLTRAHDHGWEDGWRYGAAVVREHKYREGYHAGFCEALGRAATDAYARVYPERYLVAYRASFDDWSDNVHAEIRSVTLGDHNDDGIFEPGEPLAVRYEVVNYGGAGARVVVRLSGRVLGRTAEVPLELPRRSALRHDPVIEAWIDPEVRPRTRATLRLAVAGAEQALDLEVRRPLEWVGSASLIDHDALAGRGVIGVRLANRSRKPVPFRAWTRYDGARIDARGGEERAAVLGPDRTIELRFLLQGVAPLDLLGGRLRATIEVEGRGALHDRLAFEGPVLADDLGNRDLVRYLLRLADMPRVPAEDLELAQALMLRRLRADWKAAVAARGNPYREDLRGRSGQTAMGELVVGYRTARSTLRHPEVFTTLAPRIETLSDQLPGAHPFLRRALNRLNRELRG